MPEDDKELENFRLRDMFDKRYVLQGWNWKIINLLVFGFVGLVTTGFVVGLVSFLLKSFTT